MSRRIWLVGFSLILFLLVALSAETISAQEAGSNSAEETRGIILLEGQAAVEKYAELTGMSVAEVEAMIARERAARLTAGRDIQPEGAGGFTALFVPECTYYGKAWGLFDVGPAAFAVQFSGTDLWVGYGFCPSMECTYIASADLNRPGDRVWAYSVYAIWAYNISNWCSWLG